MCGIVAYLGKKEAFPIIIKGLSKSGDIYDNGKILDPKIGKLYNCKIALEGKEKLIVR